MGKIEHRLTSVTSANSGFGKGVQGSECRAGGWVVGSPVRLLIFFFDLPIFWSEIFSKDLNIVVLWYHLALNSAPSTTTTTVFLALVLISSG
jgi:hypothetical protein